MTSSPTLLTPVAPEQPAPRSPTVSPAPPPHVRSGALAIASTLLPTTKKIQGANEATVARVNELAAQFGPGVGKAWTAAQEALNKAALAYTGRSLDALDADGREALLRRWERDPLLKVPLAIATFVYKTVHFDRSEIYSSLGRKLNVVEQLEQPRWLQRVQPADEWTSGDIECEVVVVGTGAGGAVVGRELANRGFAVAFVEEGEHYRRDAFDGSSVGAQLRFMRSAFSIGNVAFPIFIGRLLGGSTAVNGATCFRTPDWILDRWCEEIGTDEFAPETMRRHFEKVERFLEVQPSERRYIGPIADIMERGCNSLGWSHFAIRRNAPGCDGSGFCDFGCRTDARRSMNLSYIPAALERGAMAFTGLRAERVLLDGNRAIGVLATTKSGRTLRVRAKAVVLAGGAVPTPLLLLGQGICNSSGQVGRNLVVHPSGSFAALFDEPIQGPAHIPQGYGCDQFLRDGMLIMAGQPDANVASLILPYTGRRLMEVMEQLDQVAFFALMTRDTTANGRVWRDVGGFPAITYNVTEHDVRLMHQTMIRTGELCLAAGARAMIPLSQATAPLRGPADLEAFRKARLSASDIVRVSYHPLGTCKMGLDPRDSVVGLDHQTHDVHSLFVVDGSTVPGPIGVNPQITIMAMADRAAEHIADQLSA